MPTPATTPRPELDALVKEYDLMANASGFVGTQIMPLRSVAKQSGAFPKISKEDLLRVTSDKRAPRGGYNRIDTGFGEDTFSTEEYGLEGVVDDSLADLYEDYIDAEAEVVSQLLFQQALNQEIRHRDIVYAQSSNAVGTSWSTYATATPRDDVRDAARSIKRLVGIKPNLLVLTEEKFQDILKCSEFLDNAKFTGNPLTMGMDAQINLVSQFLGIQQIAIADGVTNTADEGQSFSGSDLWAAGTGFLAVTGNTILGGPKFGLTLGYDSDSIVGVEDYREEQARGNVLRVRRWRQEKVMMAECGWKLTNL